MCEADPNLIDQENRQNIQLTVKVVPGSSRSEITGIHNGMLKIKIAAPPEKGKANKALLAFIAKQLGVQKNALQITSGKTSCIKQIALKGVSREAVEKLLEQ
jgi:uncharacterized protein (TIGR00251 family)